MANGWADLGDMLAGGPGKRAEAEYVPQLKRNFDAQRTMYDRDKTMEEASIKRLQRIAREGITPQKFTDVGYSLPMGELAAVLTGANNAPSLTQLGTMQTPGRDIAIDMASQAMEAGDIKAYNRYTAHAAGKPYQPVRALGGAYIEDGVALGDIDMVPTLPTMTRQMQVETQLSQGQQRTDATVAKSQREPKPRSSSVKGGGNPETAVLAQARDRVAGGADPQAVADYLTRKGYPGLADKIYKRRKPAAAPAKEY